MFKNKSKKLICLILFATSFSNTFAQKNSTLQPSYDSSHIKLNLWATQYYVYHSKRSYSTNAVLLRGKGIQNLELRIDTVDFCKAAIEGSMTIIDSNKNRITLNYGGLSPLPYADCKNHIRNKSIDIDKVNRTLWILAKSNFGDGVKGYNLVPYKSIAVDPGHIKIGSVVYIPSMAGKSIPGDTILHDGYFYAVDIGSAIKGNHIDIFTGENSAPAFQDTITSDKNKTFEAFLIQNSEIKETLEKLHR